MTRHEFLVEKIEAVSHAKTNGLAPVEKTFSHRGMCATFRYNQLGALDVEVFVGECRLFRAPANLVLTAMQNGYTIKEG